MKKYTEMDRAELLSERQRIQNEYDDIKAEASYLASSDRDAAEKADAK